jgi:hypothetical protein
VYGILARLFCAEIDDTALAAVGDDADSALKVFADLGVDGEADALHARCRRFMDEAVLPWMPSFFDPVIADPRARFHSAVASAAKASIGADASALALEVGSCVAGDDGGRTGMDGCGNRGAS